MEQIEFTDNLFNDCYIPDEKWENLKNMAIQEDWNYKYDTSTVSYPILRNYIFHTYKRLYELYLDDSRKNYLVVTKNYICFNTGLLTPNYEQIYMIMAKNRIKSKKTWYCKGFFKESEGKFLSLGKKPVRAQYFKSLNDLILDPNCEIIPNVDHILQDDENKKRIPDDLRDSPYLLSIFKGQIETIKKGYKQITN